MKKKLLSFLFATLFTFIGYGQITIDESLDAQTLVEDVLINSSCAEVSNIVSSTGTDFGDVNGIAAFSAIGTDFPFEEGIILMSGNVQEAPGPNLNVQSNGGWPGDADLEANTSAVNTNNASFIEFDFTPFIEQISFDFIMASEEYDQNFECTFSDAFAFILTDVTTGDVQNLAVLPGTTIPIEVTNIRPEVPGQCAAVNEEFFDRYNFQPFNDENASATNFNGQTVELTAMADVISGNPYTIKLVVADETDSSFDIAVFLEAGSFNIGTTDLGDDILVSNGNAVCEGDTITLNAEDPDAISYTWFLNTVEIAGETDPTLVVSVPGTYSVIVSLNNTDCVIEDDIFVEFITQDAVNLGDDIVACEGDTVTLDSNILDTAATFSWFLNSAILIDEISPTLNVTQAGEYAVTVNFNSGCSFSDTVIVDLTTAPIIELGDTINSCLENPTTLDATPTNTDPADATFVWTLNGVELAGETNPTLDVTAAGIYEVTVTSGPCVVTDSVIVAALAVLFELGDDFNTCFDETVTLDATPTNIDAAAATYVWTLNGGVIAGEESPMLTITEAGNYEVTVSLGICSNTDTITVTQANPDGSPCSDPPPPSGCVVLDVGPDLEVDCENLCVDLVASIITMPLTSTSSYRIEQIECPNPPTSGESTNLTTDDLWSGVIDLPFTFNYFQNDYNGLVIGANGQISFNTALADQANGWNSDIGELLPFNDEAAEPGAAEFPFNTIYGAFHDIDPSVNADPAAINFFIAGDAPFRTFVLNFDQVPQFSCNDLLTSQQIILYESLNIIEVNIINKPVCDAWNDGLATLGIMGNDLTEFAVPDGRNTDNWEAFDESWRFIPDGPVDPDSIFTWTDEDGTVISNETTFNVCPTETTTYTATLTFTNPDGSESTVSEDVIVTSDTSSCDGPSDCTVLDAGPDLEVDCEDPCVDLVASIMSMPLTSTSSYVIEQIECPNPPTEGMPTNLTIDDSWSDVIDLPFTFNYYQNDYNGLVIGANGQISFDLALANGFNDWNIDIGQTIPNNDQATFPFNTIYGAFHDVDPSVNANPDAINYFVSGDAPFRTFVLNFDQVPQFSCNDLLTSQQIVLYESLNIIEVNIINKPVCDAWNDGLATLGIMGNDATEFAVPDGRNTDNWEAFDESWRFIPDGPVDPDSIFTWTDEDGNVISNDLIFNVCPTETTTYTATLTFTNPDGSVSTITDEVTVTANVVDYTVDLGEDQVFCDIQSYEIVPQLDGDVTDPTFLWSTGEVTETITVTTTDTYTVEVTVGGCVMTDEVTVTFLTSPCVIDTDCLVIDFLEDFGTGTERVSTPFTQYTFNGATQVNDGEYAIVNTSADLNTGWHDNLEDNTPGDVDGRALFVNADFNTDEFYRRTVDNLLADTNYTFNAFITTVYDTDTNICANNGIPANVTFRVEDAAGITLAEIDTGDIQNEADPNWQQFTIDFNSGVNNSVQIVLVNNSIGGCGNDLAIDDISLTFSGGPPVLVTPADLELCDDLNDGMEVFDLTTQIPNILNGLDPSDFNISFHPSSLEAQANANPIGTPNAYTNAFNPETIFVRVERVLDTSCFSIVEFDLILNEIVSLANNLPASIEICSTDAIPALDAAPTDPAIDQSAVTYIWTDASNTTVSTDAQFTPTVAGIYTVVVELLPCSQETFTVELIIIETPIVDLGVDELLCNNESFEIIPTLSGNLTDATFLWSTGETTQTITVDNSGTFDLTITVGPCSVTDSITITIADPVDVSLGDDFTTCREFPNTLTAISSDSNVTYEWFLNGDVITGETSGTLEFTIPQTAVGTQEFTVTTTTAAGCTSSDTVEVSLFDVGNCVITQGLSPDGTPGFNDTLDLEFLAARTGIDLVQIYNRLGTLVYEQQDYVNQWRGQTDNGNELPTGTYFYVINLEEEDPVYGRQATGWIYINRAE
ncbi:choice-of-anchor L domain-containing protein [Dokdonia sp.]|uniref:choice-of-anchor L domain-containing protein n=1 Tax=Dokdonia sp. TaxID=2024995 RepID=UPI003262CFDF